LWAEGERESLSSRRGPTAAFHDMRILLAILPHS
jgi:hypothetical protein